MLATRGLREGVTAGTQNGDEQRGLESHFSGLPVINRDLVAGIVDAELLSGTVFLAEDHVQLAGPVMVELTQPAITVSAAILFAVFLPPQLQRQVAMRLQLPADGAEIRQTERPPRR